MSLPARVRKRPGPLQRRLGLMATLALIPLAVMAIVSVILSVQAQRENVLRSAQNTLRAVSAAVDSDHNATLATLETLALSPRLQSRDLRGFHQETHELLARRPGWRNIVLADQRARQVLNALEPYGMPARPAVQVEGVLRTIREQKAEVGDVGRGPTNGQMTYSVRIPVKVGQESFVLTAVLRPDRLLRLLDRADIPAPGLMAVVDASDFIVARSRDHELWVGKRATESARQVLRQGLEGYGATTTLDGNQVITLFRRSELTGWAVTMGLPRDVIEGPATRLYFLLGGGVIASLLLGLMAAYWMSLAITRPINQLGEAALAMGRGERPVLPDTPLSELRQVGRALTAAHEEREKLLQRERESRRHAEEANRLKDEFLAMLGHELRNPLAAISNASQILDHVNEPDRNRERAPGERDIGREAREIIRRQAAHLGLLTDELADMARVMSGNILLERQPVDLDAAVRRTVETFRATGRLKDHHLDLQAGSHPVWVSADPIRLEQIAANLLTNAVKYTPPNGHLRVNVREEAQPDGARQAVFEVTDSGVGLEPDLLPRVFDLFVQGRRSLDRSQGGLGIGLTLVKRLVEAFGGSVSAHSEGPWTGSRFTVRLPAIAEPPRAQPPAAQPPGSASRRVVIVEDNEDARLSLRALLELQGHVVEEAPDGIAGIGAILRSQPDVALVDIGLPGADGYEVARRVRAELQDRIVLVAVSGYGQPEDKQKSQAAGFDLHLVKPVDLEALARVFGG